jgi:ADP-ribosylglycohydrolase
VSLTKEQCVGSIVGLAVGDAIGYPHEFRTVSYVREVLGPEGVTDFLSDKDPRFKKPFLVSDGHPPGTFTDDTQMTLAIADGILDVGADADVDRMMNAIGGHFVTWAESQDNDRSPGETCMTGCRNLKRGVAWREAGVANSKGCGSAMRVAPFGLVYDDLDVIADRARASSLLTHGHPAALEGAAAAAIMVRLAADGMDGPAIYDEVTARLGGRSGDFDACFAKLPGFVEKDPQEALVEGALGESWIAEEAAASALYCFWRHPDDFRACVLEGANTEGDSDSIACIAGSLAGARLGYGGIPPKWRQEVERAEELVRYGERLWEARL